MLYMKMCNTVIVVELLKHVYSFRLNDKLIAELENLRRKYKLTRTEVVSLCISLGLKLIKQIENEVERDVVEEVLRSVRIVEQKEG